MEKKKPDFKSKDGRVRTAAWENRFEDGRLGLSFEFERVIPNGDGGWKCITTWHLRDLLYLSHASLQAYAWGNDRVNHSAPTIERVD